LNAIEILSGHRDFSICSQVAKEELINKLFILFDNPDASIHFLVLKTLSNIISSSSKTMCLNLVQKGILNLLCSDLQKSKFAIEAMWALSNIAADSEWCAQAIFQHVVFEKIIIFALDLNNAMRREALITICNLITTSSIDFLCC
jgi:hypothetical protein